MPIWRLVCKACGAEVRAVGAAVPAKLCSCGKPMKRGAVGPAAQVMERLDNGAMPRAVERLADAERLHRDRAVSADPLAGGRKT